jgi:hypothetical protein
MRHARSVSPRGVLTVCLGMACLLLSSGCTHNYYYGYSPCNPGSTLVVPGSVQTGSVCDVPSGSTVVAGNATTSAPVVGSAVRPPRVVLSEPGVSSGGASRFSWRAADPDGSQVTTKVEGAVDSQTLTR